MTLSFPGQYQIATSQLDICHTAVIIMVLTTVDKAQCPALFTLDMLLLSMKIFIRYTEFEYLECSTTTVLYMILCNLSVYLSWMYFYFQSAISLKFNCLSRDNSVAVNYTAVLNCIDWNVLKILKNADYRIFVIFKSNKLYIWDETSNFFSAETVFLYVQSGNILS